ncbi:hypothetical protein AC1031_018048 [Aphanomyces cochlioides]|nr:hypothetical protein AC1031_018048 [Aphanomyces cochlioides]
MTAALPLLRLSLNGHGVYFYNFSSCRTELITPLNFIWIPEDLSSIEGFQCLVTALQERESMLHTLINNSGIACGGGFPTRDKKRWNKVMDLNLTAPFFLTKFLLPVLQTNARVINVGSIADVMPQKLALLPTIHRKPLSAASQVDKIKEI